MESMQRQFFSSRRGRTILENLTAYLFLAPAGILIFLFGIFPVAFALFVSLHEWRRFPEAYAGLDNYVEALDNFAYVLFFWLALGAVFYAIRQVVYLWQKMRANGEPSGWLMLIPGILNTAAVLMFARWFFILLPVVLEIPQRIRGQERTQGLFVSELFASFQIPAVTDAGNVMLLSTVSAIFVMVAFSRLKLSQRGETLIRMTGATLFIAISFLILQLMSSEIGVAIEAARANGTELPIWSQIIFITLGAALLIGAYFVWIHAIKREEGKRFAFYVGVAALLLVGGYLLVVEIPPAMANSDDDLLKGLAITAMFAAGTVPVQLAIGLLIATMLFQNIQGKSFFRVVYFLPYITPFVATSVVFRILFAQPPTAPVNQFVGMFGVPAQRWLLEPTGILRQIFGDGVPTLLAGPGVALIVIMIYTVWTYVGYDAVVFLAGLSSIPSELYEAARIDGAGEWSLFRHITLPMLSPTTFFLSLIALIGTFKAFTQIWILRTPAAASSVDTVSIYIFQTVRENSNLGYGSAMAFVLFGVILLLTLFQNRIAKRSVFYG
jgi:multiple sugar transport system permease protein